MTLQLIIALLQTVLSLLQSSPNNAQTIALANQAIQVATAVISEPAATTTVAQDQGVSLGTGGPVLDPNSVLGTDATTSIVDTNQAITPSLASLIVSSMSPLSHVNDDGNYQIRFTSNGIAGWFSYDDITSHLPLTAGNAPFTIQSSCDPEPLNVNPVNQPNEEFLATTTYTCEFTVQDNAGQTATTSLSFSPASLNSF